MIKTLDVLDECRSEECEKGGNEKKLKCAFVQ